MHETIRNYLCLSSFSICSVAAVSFLISFNVFSSTPQVFGVMPSSEVSQWIKTSLQDSSGSLGCCFLMISTLDTSNSKRYASVSQWAAILGITIFSRSEIFISTWTKCIMRLNLRYQIYVDSGKLFNIRLRDKIINTGKEQLIRN